LVHQAIAGLGAALPIPEELTEMQTAMSRLGETWKRQYLIEGEAKALILLAEQRFGPLPRALRDRVENADAAAIETWLERLLAATSLETLFGTAN
jgi:hypothetical protein